MVENEVETSLEDPAETCYRPPPPPSSLSPPAVCAAPLKKKRLQKRYEFPPAASLHVGVCCARKEQYVCGELAAYCLMIPNLLLFHWGNAANGTSSYVERLNERIIDEAVAVNGRRVELRLKMKAMVVVAKARRAHGRKKYEVLESVSRLFVLRKEVISCIDWVRKVREIAKSRTQKKLNGCS